MTHSCLRADTHRQAEQHGILKTILVQRACLNGKIRADRAETPRKTRTKAQTYPGNGTTSLFAALNLLEGTVIGECHNRRRHQKFLKLLRRLDREIPKAQALHLILDNYTTHKHLEVKKRLKKHPRFKLHFTPTSSFWLNLVERVFGELTAKRIRRGVFHSVPELIDAIYKYLDTYNEGPQPLVWTAKVEDILQKVSKCKAILQTVH